MSDELKDQYDWVVLGNHPGALLAACLAAHKGASVLVLPLGNARLTSMSRSGQCMDPEDNFILGLGGIRNKPALLAEFLQHLGVPMSGMKNIDQSDDVFPQVLGPRSRVQIYRDHANLKSEFERELGGGALKKSAVLDALEQLDPEIIKYWRSFPRRAQRKNRPLRKMKWLLADNQYLGNFHGHLIRSGMRFRRPSRLWFSRSRRVDSLKPELREGVFRDFCSGLWFGLTLEDRENPALVDLIHSLGLTRTGAAFQGGQSAYRKFLTQLAKKSGAMVAQGTDCRRIFIENGKLVGVQVSQRGKIISVKGGVLGCSLEEASKYFYFSGRKWFYRVKKPPQPVGWKFTLALTVHDEAITPGMNRRMIWKEAGAPGIEIETAKPADYQLSDQGQRLIFVRTVLPYQEQSLDLRYQRLVTARMFRLLTEVLPFVEYHLVRVFPDFRTEVGDEYINDEFKEAFGYQELSDIPENLRVYQKAGDPGAGLGTSSGIEELHLASGEAYPHLGNFGGTLAGIQSVTRFLHSKRMQELIRVHGPRVPSGKGSEGARPVWEFLGQ